MSRRVAIVGQGLVTAFGETWEDNRTKILECQNAVRHMQEWEIVQGLITKLAAPCDNFVAPEHYTRKKTRSMSRVSIMATRASELALINAGLLDDPFINSGRVGVAYGSSFGSTFAVKDFFFMLTENTTGDLTANSYVKMMPQTAAVNISLFFGITGRIIPTSTACTSGSMAIGYAYEAIKNGYQDAMVAGGAEELSVCDAGVFDTMFSTSSKNDTPKLTPAPFDKDRDGLVIGEGAGTVVLEEYEHAKARGATVSSASSITCVVMNTERPSWRILSNSAHIFRRREGSIPTVGSSKISKSGFPSRAMASDKRRFIPPE